MYSGPKLVARQDSRPMFIDKLDEIATQYNILLSLCRYSRLLHNLHSVIDINAKNTVVES